MFVEKDEVKRVRRCQLKMQLRLLLKDDSELKRLCSCNHYRAIAENYEGCCVDVTSFPKDDKTVLREGIGKRTVNLF